MRQFIKPTLLISSCIENKACRYDGSGIKDSFIKKLKNHVHVIEVCPETAIGLPIPRDTLRIISKQDGDKRLVFSKTGDDVTHQMQTFASDFLEKLSDTQIDGAILKGRSPSCGIKDVKIYKDFGKSPSLPQKTSGLFAEKVLALFPQIAVEDEGRLMNYSIREHFLTRIFSLAAFRELKKKKDISALVQFQSENKYLLMSYSPTNQKVLGKLTANHEERDIEALFNEYEFYLNKALAVPLKPMRNVNTLLHLFGYFKDELSKHEKAYFLDSLESYRDRKVPFSVPLAIIHAWVIRFENSYLMHQTLFELFPDDLVEVTDSGKGV